MAPATMAISRHPAWRALEVHQRTMRDRYLRELLANDPNRGERMQAEAVGIYLDYSKNRITQETLQLLFELAEAIDLRGRIEAMFRGDKINVSEARAVFHTALRPRRPPRSWSTARMWCLRCISCWIGWPDSRTAFAVVFGRGTPAAASATSLTSASAVPTSGRRWRTRR